MGQTTVNLGLALGGHDEQRPDAPLFASGEGPGEEDKTVAAELLHEPGVVAHSGLFGDPFTVRPGGSSFADDGEVAHGSFLLRAGDQIVELVLEPVAAVGRAVCGESGDDRVLDFLLAV